MLVCVAKTPTDIYLDFLPWLWAMSLRLSLKVCATFMDADCCSENVVWGALWSLSWYFVFHYFVFCPKFHRLHPRPHYFFLGRLKDAVLVKESALIEFFLSFLPTQLYTTISNNTYTAMKDNLKTTTYVHLCFDLGICISKIMILSLNFGYQLTRQYLLFDNESLLPWLRR